MRIYVSKLYPGASSATVAVFAGNDYAYKNVRHAEYLQRAIDERYITEAGQYVVAVPTETGLNASLFDVEPVPTPMFKIKEHNVAV